MEEPLLVSSEMQRSFPRLDVKTVKIMWSKPTPYMKAKLEDFPLGQMQRYLRALVPFDSHDTDDAYLLESHIHPHELSMLHWDLAHLMIAPKDPGREPLSNDTAFVNSMEVSNLRITPDRKLRICFDTRTLSPKEVNTEEAFWSLKIVASSILQGATLFNVNSSKQRVLRGRGHVEYAVGGGGAGIISIFNDQGQVAATFKIAKTDTAFKVLIGQVHFVTSISYVIKKSVELQGDESGMSWHIHSIFRYYIIFWVAWKMHAMFFSEIIK